MADSDDLSLAAEFPAATQAEWRKLVDTALKGADFDKRLVSRTHDDLKVSPLYPRAANAAPVAGRAARHWQVLQRVDHPDPAAANTQALQDLENGADGLALIFVGATGAYGYGLDSAPATAARVLEGVYLDAAIPVEVDTNAQHKEAGHVLAAEIKKRGIDPAATQIRFGYDPLGTKARSGSSSLPAAEIDKAFVEIVGGLVAQGFKGPFAVADGRSVHAAGGSEAQELGFAIGNAVAYLRMFTDAGIKPDEARRLIWFRLTADADEFLTIAKFRALRKLWARVQEACGLAPEPGFVSAETAWRMMTRRDPYVNMLRTTIAVTAAGLGGADAIIALPFTAALGLPDSSARRIARNMQLILLEESNLGKVADPASGSGGIEALTDQLARAAWGLLQEIEAAGGAGKAIEKSLIQKKVAAVRAARQAAIAKRKDALTGTSDYPHLSEAAVKVLDVKPVVVEPPPAAIKFEALPVLRVSEPFEKLRDRSDATLKRTGARPKVFLANLGPAADFTARATFARNFYEAGGIEALSNDGFTGSDNLTAAFQKSGAALACLCSSDAVYAGQAAKAAKALVEAGAIVHLAGRPGEHEASLRAAGVRTFIYSGSDVLATLQAVHDILEQS